MAPAKNIPQHLQNLQNQSLNDTGYIVLAVIAIIVIAIIVLKVYKKKKGIKKKKVSFKLSDFTQKIIGQDNAIEEILRSIQTVLKDPARSDRPRYICFILGPSGVGKTEFVKTFSNILKLPLYIFNMADYAGKGSSDVHSAHWRLFGSAPGYADGEIEGEFIKAVKGNTPCVILLDEIEKTNKKVLDTFLTAFQDGFVKSNRGIEYSIANTFIFCTSNACQDTSSSIRETELKKLLINEGFKREFIGRFDKVIAFNPIDLEAAKEIFISKIKENFDRIIDYDDKALELLLSKYGFQDFGVRAIFRAIQEENLQNIPKKIKKIVISDKPVESKDTISIVINHFSNEYLQSLKALPEVLAKKIIGQDSAIDELINVLKARAIGVTTNPNRPLGTFLMIGPTGVGKTELVKVVSETTHRPLLRFDMGEFKNTGAAQRFFGAPPGYVGSNKGGQLTQAVLKHPDAVILLDEIEKADTEIWDTFLSVFDDGVLTDASTGVKVSFKNTIIFMTSNLKARCSDYDKESLRTMILETGYFRPEFVNRIDSILCFNAIDYNIAKSITKQKIDKIIKSVQGKTRVTVEYTDDIVEYILKKAEYDKFGARNIEKTAEKLLGEMLFDLISAGSANKVHLGKNLIKEEKDGR